MQTFFIHIKYIENTYEFKTFKFKNTKQHQNIFQRVVLFLQVGFFNWFLSSSFLSKTLKLIF